MKGTVHTQIDNSIATITFQHPASNSCDPEMLAEMADSIKNLANIPRLKSYYCSLEEKKLSVQAHL